MSKFLSPACADTLKGAHADVGGGSHPNTELTSLSAIPLRWMVKECIIKKTGILFNSDVLSSFGFDHKAVRDSFNEGLASPHDHPEAQPHSSTDGSAPEPFVPSPAPAPPAEEHSLLSTILAAGLTMRPHNFDFRIIHPHDVLDRIASIFDQLKLVQTWWLIEYLPTLTTYQGPDGTWIRKRMYVRLKCLVLSFSLTFCTGGILVRAVTYPSSKTRFWFTSLSKIG